MKVTNPKRILAISLDSDSQLLSQLIRELTGTSPEPLLTQDGRFSLAGASHTLSLTTSYYTANVPIWIDIVNSAEEWADSFTAPEARQVLDVLGAVVVLFDVTGQGRVHKDSTSHVLPVAGADVASSPLTSHSPARLEGERPHPADKADHDADSADTTKSTREKQTAVDGVSGLDDVSSTLTRPAAAVHGSCLSSMSSLSVSSESTNLVQHVGRVMDVLGGWSWDGVGLAIGVGGTNDQADEVDDACALAGLEFVHIARLGQLEDGNLHRAETTDDDGFVAADKLGIDRVLEALKTNDWTLVSFDDMDAGKHEDGDNNDDDSFANWGYGFDKRDIKKLTAAIYSGDVTNEEDDADAEKARKSGDEDPDKADVEELERLIMKMRATRDLGAGMPEEQRKRLAKKTVDEVMSKLY